MNSVLLQSEDRFSKKYKYSGKPLNLQEQRVAKLEVKRTSTGLFTKGAASSSTTSKLDTSAYTHMVHVCTCHQIVLFTVVFI